MHNAPHLPVLPALVWHVVHAIPMSAVPLERRPAPRGWAGPCSTVRVWSPTRPSPGLHHRSWSKCSVDSREAAWCCTKSNNCVWGRSKGAPDECNQTCCAILAPVRRFLAALTSTGLARRLPRCQRAGLASGVLGGGVVPNSHHMCFLHGCDELADPDVEVLVLGPLVADA